jgi:hypothetical protein
MPAAGGAAITVAARSSQPARRRAHILSHAADRLIPDSQQLLARARSLTGLEDFGAEGFETPLRILVDAMRGEANLSEAGMQAQLREILAQLCVNLRTQAFFNSHPEIEDQEIVAPVVIVGLQRTGTSKLFRDIAADQRWNVLHTWLALDPVPPAGWRPGEADSRIAAAEDWCASRRWMAKAHAFSPMAPEMEAVLMKRTFMLNNPSLMVPTHQRWLERADFTRAYRYLKRQLQLLQWQSGAVRGRRWILKSPPHLLSLDALISQFPDAKLVMTHRHPRSSVGSMFKLVELAQRNSANFVDRHRIRELWLRNLSLAISRFLDFRDRAKRDLFIDVSFAQLVQEPLATINRIYSHAAVPMIGEAELRIRAWHAAHPRYSEGKFEYDLSDYGLSEGDLDREFEPYLSRYAEFL